MNNKIAIIGFGHIGKAFMKGFINSGFRKENILTADIGDDNRKIAKLADWIIIALKPSIVAKVVDEIKDFIPKKIIISVAAGITISNLEKYAGNKKQKIIRLMPNIPVAENAGVIGFFANKNVGSDEKKAVIKLLSKIGKVIECKKESDLDIMTIISGSGPAIVAYCISMLSKSAEKFGLEKNISQEIAVQTFAGTLSYLQRTKQTPLELQEFVATKGGTTEEIIKSFAEEKLPDKFLNSLKKGLLKIENGILIFK